MDAATTRHGQYTHSEQALYVAFEFSLRTLEARHDRRLRPESSRAQPPRRSAHLGSGRHLGALAGRILGRYLHEQTAVFLNRPGAGFRGYVHRVRRRR